MQTERIVFHCQPSAIKEAERGGTTGIAGLVKPAKCMMILSGKKYAEVDAKSESLVYSLLRLERGLVRPAGHKCPI
jgi:hypothetical protein